MWLALLVMGLWGGVARGAEPRADAEVEAGWEVVLTLVDGFEAGGINTAQGPDGAAYLMVPGRATTKPDADVRTLVAARRVADLDARATFARFVAATVETESRTTTVRITTLETNTDGTVERRVRAQRSFRELTRERAALVLQGARVVGTWSAGDGSTLFVALAVPIPNTTTPQPEQAP